MPSRENGSKFVKWNNDLRYKRISELPDGMQEYMEDYIPQFVPAHLRHHIDYFFECLRCRGKTDGNLIPLKKVLRSNGTPVLM